MFTDKLSEVGTALEQYIKAGAAELGILDVWYSEDTGSVPRTPSVVIEPNNKNRVRSDTGHTTINTFNVEITVFHSRLEAPYSLQRASILRRVLVSSNLGFLSKTIDPLRSSFSFPSHPQPPY